MHQVRHAFGYDVFAVMYWFVLSFSSHSSMSHLFGDVDVLVIAKVVNFLHSLSRWLQVFDKIDSEYASQLYNTQNHQWARGRERGEAVVKTLKIVDVADLLTSKVHVYCTKKDYWRGLVSERRTGYISNSCIHCPYYWIYTCNKYLELKEIGNY